METVELKFQYTQREYVLAEKQYLIANKTIRKYDVILVTIYLLFSIGYLFFSSFSLLSLLSFGLGLAVCSIGCFLYMLMPILKFKQTAKYHEEYTLVFSKINIIFKTPSVESEMKWTIKKFQTLIIIQFYKLYNRKSALTGTFSV